MGGINLNLAKNSEILSIKSPKISVGGPYKVVFKNMSERWAIVALNWNNEPRLGIRWFWDKAGNPISRGYPTWFVIPNELTDTILSGLPIDFETKSKIKDFLKGVLKGESI